MLRGYNQVKLKHLRVQTLALSSMQRMLTVHPARNPEIIGYLTCQIPFPCSQKIEQHIMYRHSPVESGNYQLLYLYLIPSLAIYKHLPTYVI